MGEPQECGLFAWRKSFRSVDVSTATTTKRDQPMQKIQRIIGLDVHRDTPVIAVTDEGRVSRGRLLTAISIPSSRAGK